MNPKDLFPNTTTNPPMTVKSDKWISRMAREHGMIVPFEERLIREIEGRRIISAGLSSYGYDIRLAKDGFYIFSPIKGREIDPKNFDSDSLIEAPLRTAEDGSQYWLLPPLSYALGVTVETFNIPRRVIGLCFGKCLTGDTRVLDAQTGQWLELRRFVEENRPQTATLGPQGVNPGRVSRHLCTGIQPVFELTTDSGRSIRATARHPILTPQGWRALRSLLPGDRIAVPRCLPIFGARDLPDQEIDLLALVTTAALLDHDRPPAIAWTESRPVDSAAGRTMWGDIGSKTFSSLNLYGKRRPSGMSPPPADLSPGWIECKGDPRSEQRIADEIFTASKRCVARFLRTVFTLAGVLSPQRDGSPTIFLRSCHSERLVRDIQHLLLRFGVQAKLVRGRAERCKQSFSLVLSNREALIAFAQHIGFVPGTEKDLLLRTWVDWLKDTVTDGWFSNQMGFPPLVWDSVVSLAPRGNELVYDLTIPGTHNFIANDLVVHNSTYARSGVIVNATPLEPTWRGRLVLEISNSADLPVRIYAEEGIAQVVFFESDEDCLTAYEDRQGKYQDQKGLVTPKV